jgi:hypothetical protein
VILLKDILLEVENQFIEIGYHFTVKDRLESILQEGLKINQPKHHILTDTGWATKAYGMVPIFMSTSPIRSYQKPGEEWVLLKVNVKGLDIAADLGTLIDFDAHLTDTGFEFKNKYFWLNGTKFTYDELQGSNQLDLKRVINQTRTFVVLQDISPDRIKVIDRKGKYRDAIKKLMGFNNESM